MYIRKIFQRYPIGSYFVLAYLISWGGSIAFGGGQFLRKEAMEFERARDMALIVLAGPFLAGILSTYLPRRKRGSLGSVRPNVQVVDGFRLVRGCAGET
jgi:hypothetical protein